MTLNDLERPKRTLVQKRCVFGADCTNLNEDRPIHAATKCRPMTIVSGNVRYMDIRGASCWRGPQMRVGLLTTEIFGDLSGYFFGNFRDEASNVI